MFLVVTNERNTLTLVFRRILIFGAEYVLTAYNMVMSRLVVKMIHRKDELKQINNKVVQILPRLQARLAA